MSRCGTCTHPHIPEDTLCSINHSSNDIEFGFVQWTPLNTPASSLDEMEELDQDFDIEESQVQ
jgi:hypothetical protein